MKTRLSLVVVGLLAAFVAQSLEADPAPLRSISVATVDVPSDPGAYAEIEVEEAFLARISPRLTLVGKAAFIRYAPDNVAPRAGLGAAWDFGGGLYVDGYCVLGWAPTLDRLEYDAMAALNYETESLYAAVRSVLRERQGSFSSISTFWGSWSWAFGLTLQGMYGFAWERGAGFGHSVWVEANAPVLPWLVPHLGGTLSKETNGDVDASVRIGLDLIPWKDIKIVYVAEPFFLDYSGKFTHTVSVDVSFR